MHHPYRWVMLLVALSSVALAQAPSARERSAQLDWRHIGNTNLELGLASPAGGPVDRTWYSDDGSTLYVRIAGGRVFETSDFEQWKASTAVPPADAAVSAARGLPEGSAKLRTAFGRPDRVYAVAKNAFRSDDGGLNWTNLTQYQNRSIIGEGLLDVAISPRDPDEVVAAGSRGVWRTLDGGTSWTGLNQGLPNLPVRHFVRTPDAGTVRISIDDSGNEVEWRGGEKIGWRPAAGSVTAAELKSRSELSTQLAAPITAVASAGEMRYAGSSDGRVWASPEGRIWQPFKFSEEGAVTAIVADPRDPQFAVALLTGKRTQIARTANGGRFWDIITDNLPNVAARGIAVDRASGAVYVASASGVFLSYGANSPQGSSWTLLRAGNALDVMLDADGNQLYVAFEGVGVYATLAPHRIRDPRVVSSGDLASRAAAPGSLLTVIGTKVQAARTGEFTAPVLASSDTQSQIQIPFEARGDSISLALDSSAGRLMMGLPLLQASPAIFIDPDGSPLIVNADTGLMLDGAAPARRNSRLQIFATGLGRVRPEWPTGVAAPLEGSPTVVAPVFVYLDGQPLEVTRAVLAPGYVGFYLVEVQLPDVVNAGTAELHIEMEGHQSNHVRIYLEP